MRRNESRYQHDGAGHQRYRETVAGASRYRLADFRDYPLGSRNDSRAGFPMDEIGAKNDFQQLQQKIQHDASQIDNYLEQRVMVLKNAAGLVAKAVDLDKDIMKSVAALRSGHHVTETNRSE